MEEGEIHIVHIGKRNERAKREIQFHGLLTDVAESAYQKARKRERGQHFACPSLLCPSYQCVLCLISLQTVAFNERGRSSFFLSLYVRIKDAGVREIPSLFIPACCLSRHQMVSWVAQHTHALPACDRKSLCRALN